MGMGGCTGGLEAVVTVPVVTVPAVPQGCPKVRRILEIWASGQGVISVHCFQSTVPAEAYTREGCLVEALGERGRGVGGDGAALAPCPSSRHWFCHHSSSLHPSLPPHAGVGGTPSPSWGTRGL